MTAKKKNPGKRGRKPSPPGAKLSQLTIRLPPTQRLGLELLSRELGLSISQVVERALAHTLATWMVAGKPAEQQVMSFGVPGQKFPADPLAQEAIAEEVLESETLFIVHLPKELRREHEQLFFDVLWGLYGDQEGLPFAINGEEAEELLHLCKLAFRRGFTVEEVMARWRQVEAESKE